jgi:uncharacterized protein YxjI
LPVHDDPFAHAHYLIRRKVFKLLGQAFHIYDLAGNLVMYSKLKAFKLREDIRLYTNEDMSVELLAIQARQIIDFSAAYDVVDVPAQQKVGALCRKGLKSLIQDEWIVMDEHDQQVGTIHEDSTGLALLRRFVDLASLVFPQQFRIEMGGATVCTLQQNHNPFVRKLTIDFGHDTTGQLDRRLGLAAAVLLSAIEGRQG